ncbi:hypothetical protein [Vibrio galatheae]|uniref:hypothetical protein n=1 Tax=Vibrio galatheae TaxID=579748 RepID=UPI0012ECFDAE|nr:hypothetical protein [Vibrio galatheae]
MCKAKLAIGDVELQIPLRREIYAAISENPNKLSQLNFGLVCLLKEMFPPKVRNTLLTLQVGDAELDFEMDSGLATAIAETYRTDNSIEENYQKEFEDLLRQSIPSHKRPPSSRQYSYMYQIADTLNIEIPEKALRDTDFCSEFIDENVDEFKVVQARHHALVREANRVARWAVAFHMAEKGIELKEIAKYLSVVKEETVQKYLMNFDSWLNEFATMNSEKQKALYHLINFVLEHEHPLVGRLELRVQV